MVKNTVISVRKANNLFWLGRYEERVYVTLHILRKCYDKMIDGQLEDYWPIWQKLDTAGRYQTREEFVLGMMYDRNNPASVISAQVKAMDNAILLRENIKSETLSYLEMSMALLNECRDKQEMNVICLQPVIDWSLAFWGSAEQRIQQHDVLFMMMVGRNLENLDMLLRFDYPYDRIVLAYESLKRYCLQVGALLEAEAQSAIDHLIEPARYNLRDIEYKNQLLRNINHLVRL